MQVDDFLYVTPSYEHAVAFLTLMLRGIPEYNCHVNHAKTLCNFTVDSPGVAVRRLAAGALFPWCGLLFDTDTLAVVADYTRYAGVPMSDTLSVDLSHHAGRALRNKLIFTLRARCHRIFFDATVNSAAVQNVYRVFLLAAFKLHAYAAHLPNSGPLRNAAFLVDVIFHVAGFVQSSYAAAAGGLIAAGGGLVDSPAALQWLCFEAFQRKLSRHAGVYAAVLSAIVERQTALRRHVDDRRLADLTRIVGDDLPADFQYILP